MEAVFRSLKQRWNQLNSRRIGQYYGIVIDRPEDPLTNLRFADDVLLISSNRADVAKMIADLQAESSKYGLKLHSGKTSIITNSSRSVPEHISCRGLQVRTLPAEESEKYLGRMLTTTDFHEKELENRLHCGWKAFFKFKTALTNKKVSMRERTALFESVVTPCVLYACCAWTLTASMEDRMRRCRRRMLRWMVGVGKKRDEAWPDYMRRATRTAEDLVERHGGNDWISLYRRRRWAFASKTAAKTDGRWTSRLLHWIPFFRCLPYRSVGRPHTRWEDHFVKTVGGNWLEYAAEDEQLWGIFIE